MTPTSPVPIPPARPARRARRIRRVQRAYTAVEIMLSIAVLGIGAAGVMSMQKASIQGNADAHMLDVGNSIAREWIERLRRDGMTWTGTAGTPGSVANTMLLSQMSAKPGVWLWPALPTGAGFNATNSVDPGFSPGFDILGRDIILTGAAQPGVTFCAQVRGDWLVADQLMRAEVRVYWLRQLYAAPSGAFCGGDTTTLNAVGAGGATQVYHFVYAATAVGRNPPP